MSPGSTPVSSADQGAADEPSFLLEPEVYALLAEVGIGVPAHLVVRSERELTEAALARLPGDEVVVKVVSPDILHKTDAGGVRRCRREPAAVAEAVAGVLEAARRARPGANLRGALVAERVVHRAGLGLELLAGFRHDPAFGPVVTLGVGGLDTERLLGALRPESGRALFSAHADEPEEILRALAPTLLADALAGRLRSSRGESLGQGVLIRFVRALAALARACAGFEAPAGRGLAELELNPVVVSEDGRLVALDGLARRHRPLPLSPARPVAQLRRLLVPGSALVIGASAEGVNAGRVILRNLVEGGGVPRERIFAVHPRAVEIDGCRAFPALAALPEPVDMAVVVVPADRGADLVVVDLVKKRLARTITLITGGFGETPGGREAEARMREAIERSRSDADGGALVNGGNCLGILSQPGRYSTFFIPPYKLPLREAARRNLASLSQSGAYLVSQISSLEGVVLPRYAVSFGNQIDLTVSDYLEHLEGDAQARVFAVYLEGFRRGDGLRFVQAARRLAAQGRPVVLYKAGRSPEGGAAAASHTAAAVGDHEVCRELASAAGVLDCATLDEFEDTLVALSLLDGRGGGDRVAILSNAGFECTVAADNLRPLRLAEPSAATRERLAALLPPGIVEVRNPLDTTPLTPTDRYAACAEALLADPGVDALVLAGVPATPYLDDLPPGPGHAEDVAGPGSLPNRLVRLFHATRKPVVLSVDAGPLYDPCVRILRAGGLPTFRKVDRAVRALARFLAFRNC